MPNSLSDMEFDEVSFVRKGANPEAKIVFWKSEDGPEEPIAEGTEDHQWALMQRRATWLMDEDPDLTRPEAIAKTLDEHPELYDPQQGFVLGLEKADPYDRERRDLFVDVGSPGRPDPGGELQPDQSPGGRQGSLDASRGLRQGRPDER